jgi:LysR family nitrogen assimilation transcriptional regulator
MSYLLKEMVLQGRLDMTVTYQFEPSPGMMEQPLFRESIYLVSPSASKIRKRDGSMSMSEVAQYPLVLSSGQTAMRRIVQTALRAQGLDVNPLAEVDSLRTLVQVVQKGHAHTILPASALQDELGAKASDSLVLNSLEISRIVVLCTSEHLPLGVAAGAVHELVVDVVQDALKRKRWIGIQPASATLEPSQKL